MIKVFFVTVMMANGNVASVNPYHVNYMIQKPNGGCRIVMSDPKVYFDASPNCAEIERKFETDK